MASKADQFKNAFREEGREVLVDLEAALLELNSNRGDPELVGRIFRALHTIKGSGAMFGFEDLATFTHNLETAFDEVRNGRIAISSELIDLTLSALDQIRAMLEEGVGDTAPADPEACAEILAKVRHLTGKVEKQPAKEKTKPPDAGSETGTESSSSAVAGQVREWQIRFAPGPEFMLNGANPLLLIRELRQMGGLAVRASMASVPPLAELDPERCYISWEMVLATAAGRDAIRDVFIFVEDACELAIEPASGAAGDSEASAPESVQKASAASAADLTAEALAEERSASGGRRTYDKPDNATSLRVPAAKLDQFVNLVGELVTVQARLSEIAASHDDPEVAAVSEEIERLTSSLRENSMNIRMTPVRATFEKFRRLVHDLARDLGKNVELTIEGAETELDKTVIDQLGDPLMHLIRNSMDHGIGSPEERARSGKPPTATIHLSARHSGASVLIGVSDDGRGIDTEAVRARAIERGLVAANAELTEAEAFALIFQPGFSTAKQVTDVSGRGVGMDVVRQRVDSLRGSIDVASKPGQGTSVTLRLPLTLAIIDGLLVGIEDSSFVVPLANILECIELTSADIERANGKHIADLRGELVPYIRLREHFSIRTPRPEIEQIMIVATESGRYGFVVDRVLGNCQTVIKNLGRFYRHVKVVSGATILGDGTVALILDPERVAQDAVRAITHGTRAGPSVAAIAAAVKQSLRGRSAAPQKTV
ncbi:MAG: chemotaxis protein CheA [Terracidiphilus sp.]|jgi:two-component system chemotaxis sensor kinase CheA